MKLCMWLVGGVAAAWSVCAPALGANAVTNAGFETGSLAPWANPTGLWRVDATVSHSGAYSAVITGHTGASRLRQMFDSPLEWENVQEISVWYRTVDNFAPAFRVYFEDGEVDIGLTPTNGQWVRFSVPSVYWTNFDVYGVEMQSGSPINPSSAAVWVDDVEVRLLPAPGAAGLMGLGAVGLLRRRRAR